MAPGFEVGGQVFVEGSGAGNNGPRVITGKSGAALDVAGDPFAAESADLAAESRFPPALFASPQFYVVGSFVVRTVKKAALPVVTGKR